MPKYILMIILVILVSYCVSGKITNSEDTIEKVNIIEDPQHFRYDSTKIDSFQINHGSINGDILTLNTTFIGGCKQHSFNFFSTHGIEFSNPPQAFAYLLHNSNDDSCTTIIEKNLRFDLSPLGGNLWIKIFQFHFHPDSLIRVYYE